MKKWRNESGQVLIITALSMTVLLGFVGFATDVGLLLRERRIAQSVADGAAIGAASEALNERFPSGVTPGMYRAAVLDAAMNSYAASSSNGVKSSTGVTLTINVGSNITIPGYSGAGNIQSIVTKSTPTIFMAAFGALLGSNFQSLDVTATAIASDMISSSGCGHIPDGNNYPVSVVMGGSSRVFANNCAISGNGNVDMGGNSNITALYFATSGSITNTGHSGITGTQAEYAGPDTDPMQYLGQDPNYPVLGGPTGCTAPGGMHCIYDQNCGSTSCTLTGPLQPYTVYYYDKSVTVTGNVSSGKDANGNTPGNTIYLAGTTPYLDFNNVGTMTLVAPGPTASSCPLDANPLCGVVIDAPLDGSGSVAPNSCSHGNGNNSGNPGEIYFDFGSSTTMLQGDVYAPYMQLFIQDQGAATTFNTNFVLGTFCSQAATLTINGFSGPLAPDTRVGLVY